MSHFDYTTKFFQRHVLTVPTFGHAVMVACAVASYENIHTFFKVLHGSDLVAIALGVAIGAALVMAAALLSGMKWDASNPRVILIASVTTLLALLSGGIQAASYASHGLWWPAAALLGLALPVVGELGIALAVSAYEQEQQAKRLAQADDEIERRINQAVDSALVDVDMSSAKRDVERAARLIVKRKMDELLERRIGKAEGDKREISAAERSSTAEMTEKRQQLAHDRQQAIATLLAGYGALSTSELRQRLSEDRGIKASDRTIRADCNKLVETGEVAKDGRKWAVVASIAETLPDVGEPVLNGHHG